LQHAISFFLFLFSFFVRHKGGEVRKKVVRKRKKVGFQGFFDSAIIVLPHALSFFLSSLFFMHHAGLGVRPGLNATINRC